MLDPKTIKELKRLNEEMLNWCIEAHEKTNHFYDEYLPYGFHLRMANKVACDFMHLIPEPDRLTVLWAVDGHDTIEDARKNYNEMKKRMNLLAAEIIRAVTNYGRGRDREERMPDFCYEDIKNTQYATFVKLCDRIANVQYGKMTGGGMFLKYKKENEHFKKMLFVQGEYEEMWNYLDELFGE